MIADGELTQDAFLGGELKIWQPRDGYRAGTDAVYLASAVQAEIGHSVLELGCGAGVAALCLAKRVKGLSITGLELQPQYASLAARNARENAEAFDVVECDVVDPPAAIKAASFDHVMANPPYYENATMTPPRNAGKETAHFATAGVLREWVETGVRRLAPKGSITLIHRVEALAESLDALSQKCGKIEVFPIVARQGRPASRVIIRARKGAKCPLSVNFPKIVHSELTHVSDAKDYSEWSDGVLRAGLSF